MDIVAQAMELSSIPTDMNNNKDILSQAIEMSDIASDFMMNFWFDYKMIVWDKLEARMRIHFSLSYILYQNELLIWLNKMHEISFNMF